MRIICATHCNLDERVRSGAFRRDLFYRLAVLRLPLPALREHAADCVPLAMWCLTNAMAALNVRVPANLEAELRACEGALRSHDWPGNVRQLRNMMERVALFLAAEPLRALSLELLQKVAPELFVAGDVKSPACAPATIADRPLLPAACAPEGETMTQVLTRYAGDRTAAARHLGISRTTLWRRLRRADSDA